MTAEQLDDNQRGRMQLNARGFRYDPQMEEAARLWREDRDRFDRLGAAIQSQLGVYLDLRDHYDAAVSAGVIADDRGPTAA